MLGIGVYCDRSAVPLSKRTSDRVMTLEPSVRGVLALSTMHPGITKCSSLDRIHTRWLL